MTRFTLFKKEVNHKFVIDIEETENYIGIKVDGKTTAFDEDKCAIDFMSSRKFGDNRVTGLSLKDKPEIVNVITKARTRIREALRIEKEQRNADRPAPTLDTEKYFVFSYGCDTGQIYPTEYEKAIEEILSNGLKADKVFRGKRDKNRKFPGSYDGLIPSSYVSVHKEKEKLASKEYEVNKYAAEGYDHVWNEGTYALPKTLVEEAKQKLDEERAKAIEERIRKEEESTKWIFEKAKSTGQKQLLEEWNEECNDDREECNVDNLYTYAMPDGTTITERSHTW